jgi:transglutaminase-like putative cysteine protease
MYDSDLNGRNEYWKFPLETITDGAGDCEDTSILFAAIMSYMGYDTCLFLFTDHMAVGIALESFTASGHSGPGISSDRHSVEVGNTDYYYCETTNRDWCIGDVWSAEYPLKYRVGLVVPQYS